MSGHNIEVGEIGYKFKNRVLGESKMSLLTALELISLVLSQIFGEKFQPGLYCFAWLELVEFLFNY